VTNKLQSVGPDREKEELFTKIYDFYKNSAVSLKNTVSQVDDLGRISLIQNGIQIAQGSVKGAIYRSEAQPQEGFISSDYLIKLDSANITSLTLLNQKFAEKFPNLRIVTTLRFITDQKTCTWHIKAADISLQDYEKEDVKDFFLDPRLSSDFQLMTRDDAMVDFDE
jgi:hypothetical protein